MIAAGDGRPIGLIARGMVGKVRKMPLLPFRRTEKELKAKAAGQRVTGHLGEPEADLVLPRADEKRNLSGTQ